MEFRYQIPKHLEAYLSDMTDDAMGKFMTMLFEFAVNHRMLDYPKLHIERQVDDTVNSLALLLSQNDRMLKVLVDEINTLSQKVDRMSMVEIGNSNVTKSTLYVAGLTDDDEEAFPDLNKPREEEVIEGQGNDDDEYFRQLNQEHGKQPTGDGDSADKDSEEELMDDLLA